MNHVSVFNALSSASDTVLGAASTAITKITPPLVSVWAGTKAMVMMGAGAALGPIAPMTAVAIGLAVGGTTLAAQYYGPQAVSYVFSQISKDTTKPNVEMRGVTFSGATPAYG